MLYFEDLMAYLAIALLIILGISISILIIRRPKAAAKLAVMATLCTMLLTAIAYA